MPFSKRGKVRGIPKKSHEETQKQKELPLGNPDKGGLAHRGRGEKSCARSDPGNVHKTERAGGKRGTGEGVLKVGRTYPRRGDRRGKRPQDRGKGLNSAHRNANESPIRQRVRARRGKVIGKELQERFLMIYMSKKKEETTKKKSPESALLWTKKKVNKKSAPVLEISCAPPGEKGGGRV